jgi:hypothetical protein
MTANAGIVSLERKSESDCSSRAVSGAFFAVRRFARSETATAAAPAHDSRRVAGCDDADPTDI